MISPIFVISFGIALCMIVFGINQLMNPGSWLGYIPPWLSKIMPFKAETTMRLHAVGNIVFGLFLLFPLYPLVAVWIGFIWWLSILPFAFRYDWKVGMRDLAITLALIALILLVG